MRLWEGPASTVPGAWKHRVSSKCKPTVQPLSGACQGQGALGPGWVALLEAAAPTEDPGEEHTAPVPPEGVTCMGDTALLGCLCSHPCPSAADLEREKSDKLTEIFIYLCLVYCLGSAKLSPFLKPKQPQEAPWPFCRCLSLPRCKD